MANVVGVKFRKSGKVYNFDPAGIQLKVDDPVIVETARGLELGYVAIPPKEVLATEVTTPLKPVVRKAEAGDITRAEELGVKEKEALTECNQFVTRLNLPMKLLSAEYNLEGNRLAILFSAAERVDFRELVRQLTGRLKVRVELRQVGPRDEAKIVGGCGRCGRNLCCMSFLGDFNPVSIKMAKEQNLPLNPMKISGICGRLLCCLGYESEQYHAMKEKLPREGQKVSTAMGQGIVIGTNPLKETVIVEMESQASVELPLSEITILNEPIEKRARKS